MLYKTFKKAKGLVKELEGYTRAEGKLIALVMLYLINDENLELDAFGQKLPEIYSQTMAEYGILYKGDKFEHLRRRQ